MNIDKDKLSPMMLEYFNIKEKNKDSIVLYRIGDFFEMFFDDALKISNLLDLTLTGRDCGLMERAPMCGVPQKAVNEYIEKMAKLGLKIIIVDQVEDPKLSKGLVKREIVKTVTPGTVEYSDQINNFIIFIYIDKFGYSISRTDYNTGDIYIEEHHTLNISKREILNSIIKYSPKEVFINDNITFASQIISSLKDTLFKRNIKYIQEYSFKDNEFNIAMKEVNKKFNLKYSKSDYLKFINIYKLLEYLKTTQKNELAHINSINIINNDKYMILDDATRQNLEIFSSIDSDKNAPNLLKIIDKTSTAMGKRLLRFTIENPLISKDEIEKRHDRVQIFYDNTILCDSIKDELASIKDIDKILNRISTMSADKKDLINLNKAIRSSEKIMSMLKNIDVKFFSNLSYMNNIAYKIEETIDFSYDSKHIIKSNYNRELDEYRSFKENSIDMLLQIERRDRELTGIKNLKIKYNKILGYFYEITKSNLSNVPEHFIKKSTLVNSERYVTEELKDIEIKILEADDKVIDLENTLYKDVLNFIYTYIKDIKVLSNEIAFLDLIISFAFIAGKNNYIRPKINDDFILSIKDSRHPVVEKVLSDELYIPNDVYFNSEKYIKILSGPNMSGKSTYMRQIAISLLLNQIGSFIPASYAELPIVDRIFTRIGAQDNLNKGNSTFMVEMLEVKEIIDNAGEKSFIVLDEVGRGTSTHDGISIAYSVLEYISKHIKAKTIFATHFHELLELSENLPNVAYITMDIYEKNDKVIFLRKIKEGYTKNSYGIYVAKLAGLNEEIISKANFILNSFNKENMVYRSMNNKNNIDTNENIFVKYNSLTQYISNLDLDNMTLKEAMDILYELKNSLLK